VSTIETLAEEVGGDIAQRREPGGAWKVEWRQITGDDTGITADMSVYGETLDAAMSRALTVARVLRKLR